MAVLAKVESKSQSPKVENMFSKLNLSETFFLPHLNVRSLIEIQLLDLTKKLGAVMKKQTPAPVPGTATGRAFNDDWDGNVSDDDDASTEEHNDDAY